MDELQQIEQRLQEVEALSSDESRHLADCLKRIATSSFDLSTTLHDIEQEPQPARATRGGRAAVDTREARIKLAHDTHSALEASVEAEEPSYLQLQERQLTRKMLLKRLGELLAQRDAGGAARVGVQHPVAGEAGRVGERGVDGDWVREIDAAVGGQQHGRALAVIDAAGAAEAAAGAAAAEQAAARAAAGAMGRNVGVQRALMPAAADARIHAAGPPGEQQIASDFLADKAGMGSLLAGVRADPTMSLFGSKRGPEGSLGLGLPAFKRPALSGAGPASGGPLQGILQQSMDLEEAAAAFPFVGDMVSALGHRSVAKDEAAFDSRMRKLQDSSLQQAQLLGLLAEQADDPEDRSNLFRAQAQQLSQVVAQDNARRELANAKKVLGSFPEAIKLHLTGTPASQQLVQGMAELTESQRAAMVQTLGGISTGGASRARSGNQLPPPPPLPQRVGGAAAPGGPARGCYHCGGQHNFAQCDVLAGLRLTDPAAWEAATRRCRDAAGGRRAH